MLYIRYLIVVYDIYVKEVNDYRNLVIAYNNKLLVFQSNIDYRLKEQSNHMNILNETHSHIASIEHNYITYEGIISNISLAQKTQLQMIKNVEKELHKLISINQLHKS
jgi:hypothetical protein